MVRVFMDQTLNQLEPKPLNFPEILGGFGPALEKFVRY